MWGSRYEAEHLGNAPVVAMVNLDRVGVPIGVNALGDRAPPSDQSRNARRSSASAALWPHIPWTPPPGGVEAEQR